MIELVKAKDKQVAEIDMKYVEDAIKKLNKATSQPVLINIGRHIMNSDTQDFIEQTLREGGYNTRRTIHQTGSPYDMLSVNWRT